MARVAVILSGAGVFDGSEIFEAVLTLLALDKAGAQVTGLAPDKAFPVLNHLTHEETGEERNVLVESARVVRGKVSDLGAADPHTFDAVILPGGFGAAKNLCTYAQQGDQCEVDPGVRKFLTSMYRAGKPIG